MQMTFRWYGDGNDDITPEMIRQIPGVSGLVWALHDKQPGEIWTVEEIEQKLGDIKCGRRPTSCSGQLAIAVRKAYDGLLEPEEE